MNLDVEQKANNGSERQTEDVTPNAKQKNGQLLWTPNGKLNDGSERQSETTALNPKVNWITMNVKLRMMTLNVVTEKIWWL